MEKSAERLSRRKAMLRFGAGAGMAVWLALSSDDEVWDRDSDPTGDTAGDTGPGVDFGFALPFGSGSETCVAINANGALLEIHRASNGDALLYRVGRTHQADVVWGPDDPYDSGAAPCCAINKSGIAVAVHKNGELRYRVGMLRDQSVDWQISVAYRAGDAPAIAINDSGIVIEAHEERGCILYRVGKVQKDSLRFGPNQSLGSGRTPTVALNNHAVVVLAYRSADDHRLWYQVGQISGDSISWGVANLYGTGIAPSIALADDSGVIEAHQTRKAGGLHSRSGLIREESIIWGGSGDIFEDGKRPSVTISPDGKRAVQTHQSPDGKTLRYSTALRIDRASWMQDALPVIGEKSLRQITIPGSHDAGMYQSHFPQNLAQTQDIDLYGQLKHGIRYFDLRPRWTGKELLVIHGPITGRPIRELLQGVQQFLKEGYQELIVLKFSHYDNFDSSGTAYRSFVKDIQETVGLWLYTQPLNGKRLADIPLRELIEARGQVIVVCDGGYARDTPTPGIWIYRDWEAHDPQHGDLRVFDQYANTLDCDKMMADQIGKFESYNGFCKNAPDVPCDLFLLSWTLTPITNVWDACKPANSILSKAVSEMKALDRFGQIVNIIYVDYAERSRATDACLYLNGIV